jgi:hypothetical protein
MAGPVACALDQPGFVRAVKGGTQRAGRAGRGCDLLGLKLMALLSEHSCPMAQINSWPFRGRDRTGGNEVGLATWAKPTQRWPSSGPATWSQAVLLPAWEVEGVVDRPACPPWCTIGEAHDSAERQDDGVFHTGGQVHSHGTVSDGIAEPYPATVHLGSVDLVVDGHHPTDQVLADRRSCCPPVDLDRRRVEDVAAPPGGLDGHGEQGVDDGPSAIHR